VAPLAGLPLSAAQKAVRGVRSRSSGNAEHTWSGPLD